MPECPNHWAMVTTQKSSFMILALPLQATHVDRQCPPLPHYPPQQGEVQHCFPTRLPLSSIPFLRSEIWLLRPKEGDTQASAKEADKPILSAGLPLHCLPTWVTSLDTVTEWSITVYSKRNAHLIPIFFVAPPPWGRRAKIHMMDYVNYKIDHVKFWPPFPRGATKKLGIKCAFLME